ncbi:hypothetical protein BDM02DRAFT_2126055 [Thelephora ganbajun]|uniref:Uncharacterized protein n=1 Tax=Thelephora ganbajun TaxID=370292 RepID=A0ACB6ZTV3_THEGA|nr:hypothetical protein BDM02DRAFT_2126055 [Thelephora ganbajun]
MSVTIFDPVFTPDDASYLRDHAGYVVLSTEPENYEASSDTVAYMPHCDLSLFETFLRDNWFPGRISNIVLVGNNLSDYADNIPSRKLSAVYPCVAKLVPYLESRPIPRSDLLWSAFNSISMQRIRGSAVLPKYDDHHFWSQSQSDATTLIIRQKQTIPRYRKTDGAILERRKIEGEGERGERMQKL